MKTTYNIDMNILVLDDESFMHKILGHMLTGLGYTQISYFKDSISALDARNSSNNMPDLILLDINMPGTDGIEFIRHLMEQHYTGSLILISGENERILQATEKLARAHHLVVLGSLQKPTTSARLNALLELWKPLAAKKPHMCLSA